MATLVRHRGQLPGATDQTPLLVVSRSGVSVSGVPSLSPGDLLAGW